MNVLSNDSKPEIIEEEDKPFHDGDHAETVLSEKEIKLLQKKVKIAGDIQNIGLKDKAFVLLKWCLILLFLLVIIDCVVVNIKMKSSSLLNGSFEFLKYVISSLIGFVFAIKASETK